MLPNVELRGLFLATSLRPLGPRALPSGVDKRPVPAGTRLHVGRDGIEGDLHGDTRVHGGPEKAIHHYPFEHYAWWRERLPAASQRFDAPPAFGENFSTVGLTEESVCLGDVFAWGEVRLQVSQGRQPCWRIRAFNGAPELPREVQRTGRSGWYYRVLETGSASRDDLLRHLERPHPEWPLSRLLRLLYVDTLDFDGLAQMAELEVLAPGWRKLAKRRLERGEVEDWEPRLSGA